MRTVLVIEDDLPLCWLLEEILTKEYKVKVFTNGFAAWNWLKEGNLPDLIISDIHMPYGLLLSSAVISNATGVTVRVPAV